MSVSPLPQFPPSGTTAVSLKPLGCLAHSVSYALASPLKEGSGGRQLQASVQCVCAGCILPVIPASRGGAAE